MTSKIIVIGVNHDSAPVDVRERAAFCRVVPEAISDLISSTQLEEGVILSTCNRTEIYGWFSQEDQAAPRMTCFSGWQKFRLSSEDLATCTYQTSCLAHLVRVAARLTRWFCGELDYSGQIRRHSRYRRFFEQTFPEAFRLAKRVRTDTAIGENLIPLLTLQLIWQAEYFRILATARHCCLVRAKLSSSWLGILMRQGSVSSLWQTEHSSALRLWPSKFNAGYFTRRRNGATPKCGYRYQFDSEPTTDSR